MNVQFINDASGKAAYAVIPISDFNAGNYAAGSTGSANASLLSEDGLFIRLPHGGPGARLDLRRFVDVWLRRGTINMAINARKQAYAAFKPNVLNSLDPVLRRCFLDDDSPYRNSMQASVAVVDALVSTGMFTRTEVVEAGKYYRAVHGIKIDEKNALEFIQKHGRPADPVDPMKFILP